MTEECAWVHGWEYTSFFIWVFSTYLHWNASDFAMYFSSFFTAMQETPSVANWESESMGSALLTCELIFRHILEPPKSYHLTGFYCYLFNFSSAK